MLVSAIQLNLIVSAVIAIATVAAIPAIVVNALITVDAVITVDTVVTVDTIIPVGPPLLASLSFHRLLACFAVALILATLVAIIIPILGLGGPAGRHYH